MEDRAVVRRVIPADNSCLFNAVGYVMERDRNISSELREVIATTVASDPEHYNEAFLGKSNQEYCSWILEPNNWGGAIELSILADYYGREIAVYDIQSQITCHLYGQGKDYKEQVMLIYDGLHYDALAMSLKNAPEEFDQTIFTIDRDGNIGFVQALALSLADETKRQRTFTLRYVCRQGVVGQAGAVEHATVTGHINFQEY